MSPEAEKPRDFFVSKILPAQILPESRERDVPQIDFAAHNCRKRLYAGHLVDHGCCCGNPGQTGRGQDCNSHPCNGTAFRAISN